MRKKMEIVKPELTKIQEKIKRRIRKKKNGCESRNDE